MAGRNATPTPTPEVEVVDLDAIVAAAPAAANRPQALSEMTDVELKTEFDRVSEEGNTLRAQEASPSRNGKLAANTTRMKQIVEEARNRIAARTPEAA